MVVLVFHRGEEDVDLDVTAEDRDAFAIGTGGSGPGVIAVPIGELFGMTVGLASDARDGDGPEVRVGLLLGAALIKKTPIGKPEETRALRGTAEKILAGQDEGLVGPGGRRVGEARTNAATPGLLGEIGDASAVGREGSGGEFDGVLGGARARNRAGIGRGHFLIGSVNDFVGIFAGRAHQPEGGRLEIASKNDGRVLWRNGESPGGGVNFPRSVTKDGDDPVGGVIGCAERSEEKFVSGRKPLHGGDVGAQIFGKRKFVELAGLDADDVKAAAVYIGEIFSVRGDGAIEDADFAAVEGDLAFGDLFGWRVKEDVAVMVGGKEDDEEDGDGGSDVNEFVVGMGGGRGCCRELRRRLGHGRLNEWRGELGGG